MPKKRKNVENFFHIRGHLVANQEAVKVIMGRFSVLTVGN